MFSFILFRPYINYILSKLLNLGNHIYYLEISTVMMYMTICQASYMYILTVYTSLNYILKHKISNLTTYTCVMASTDLGAFSLFKRQNFITINLKPASVRPFRCSSLLRLPQSSPRFERQQTEHQTASQFNSLSETSKKVINSQISYKDEYSLDFKNLFAIYL